MSPRPFVVDLCTFENITIVSIFKLISALGKENIDTMVIQNSRFNIGNYQYLLYLHSYSLVFQNNTLENAAFNHALRWELNIDYCPLVRITNSSFLNSYGWFIDGNAYSYNALLSYDNLTAQSPYHESAYEIDNCLFQGLQRMTLVEGRKSFLTNFTLTNSVVSNYTRANLQWSLLGIGPFVEMKIINVTCFDSLVWEFVNVRWSPIETLLGNLTFNNTVLQALYHIRIIYTPSQYFFIEFRNISILRFSDYNKSNVITNLMVDHAQPGSPTLPEYIPLIRIIDCNFHITVNLAATNFLQMFKFLYPLHLEIISCKLNFHGPMVITQSLFCYISNFMNRFTISNTSVYNDAYTSGAINSVGLAIIGYNITFQNSYFKQIGRDFLYAILSTNTIFQILSSSFENWVFNVDGLSNKFLISKTLFNLTIYSLKMNSQHLQLSNQEG